MAMVDTFWNGSANDLCKRSPEKIFSSPQGPATPQYASSQRREESFQHWPQALIQTPQEMAEAGFIYQGKLETALLTLQY